MGNRTDPIAVFDSGVGGISVLRELVKLLPGENFLYYGDNANAPYGTKTTEEVRRLTMDAAAMLFARGAKALVVACNTATSAAIEDLRREFPQKVVIGIEPALKVGADRYPGGRIGIMATDVTLREEKLHHQIQRFPQATVIPIPAPGLVERIEQGQTDSEITRQLLEEILCPYAGKLDALVLGCTHYPFAAGVIRKIMGETTELLDGGAGTARQTKRCLENAELLNPGPGSVQIESSGGACAVALARKLLREGR